MKKISSEQFKKDHAGINIKLRGLQKNKLLKIFNILCGICLYLSTVAILPNTSHAYFQSEGGEQSFLKAAYKVKESKTENIFALYDDINSTGTGKKQIIFPKSKFFISVDLISVAFPLPLIFYNYSSTDNALADLIYANLKLKKLIDEYKNIQERSQQLAWDSQYLFKHKDTTDSIYQIAARHKESSKQTMDESGLVLNYQTHTLLSSQGHFVKSSSTMTQINTNKSWTAPNNIDGEKTTSNKNSNNPFPGGSDPLIVKIFIGLANIIPYIITHKGETVFYGIGLTLIFLFFSSLFKR